VEEAHRFLQQANWLVLTLGSAFVYELRNNELGGSAGDVVANCHKVPASHFVHRLASLEEISVSLRRLITSMRQFNPGIRILFTISPVRHHREGIVENNRSKATLHLAVLEMLNAFPDVFYFPAYELVIDDLRDYRFYAEDLVHPNYAATQYVWEKFIQCCVDDESRTLMQPLEQLRTAMKHRPMHPNTSQHRQFLTAMLQKVNQLQQSHPWLDLEAERAYFSAEV
nr:GSCFA domain-containing protein [Chitinophagaceae bacterium]